MNQFLPISFLNLNLITLYPLLSVTTLVCGVSAFPESPLLIPVTQSEPSRKYHVITPLQGIVVVNEDKDDSDDSDGENYDKEKVEGRKRRKSYKNFLTTLQRR